MPYCDPQLRSTASRAAPPQASPGPAARKDTVSVSGSRLLRRESNAQREPGRPARGRSTPGREEGSCSGSHVVEAEEVVAGEGAERGHGGGAAAGAPRKSFLLTRGPSGAGRRCRCPPSCATAAEGGIWAPCFRPS